jgi:hypothetical protein
MMRVTCVLYLIVVPLPPGKNPFAVKINNNNYLTTIVSISRRRCVINEYGAVGGKKVHRENRTTGRRPAPVPLCLPQIPHNMTRDVTRTPEVGINQHDLFYIIQRKFPRKKLHIFLKYITSPHIKRGNTLCGGGFSFTSHLQKTVMLVLLKLEN